LELSEAANDQLNAYYGYFSGNNGIPPQNDAPPVSDEHGGPIICEWMINAGYQDLRVALP
jgi:hypothetical protein